MGIGGSGLNLVLFFALLFDSRGSFFFFSFFSASLSSLRFPLPRFFLPSFAFLIFQFSSCSSSAS